MNPILSTISYTSVSRDKIKHPVFTYLMLDPISEQVFWVSQWGGEGVREFLESVVYWALKFWKKKKTSDLLGF
jgi:hypothetical protein